jgi:hypothetical protein
VQVVPGIPDTPLYSKVVAYDTNPFFYNCFLVLKLGMKTGRGVRKGAPKFTKH